MLIRTEYSSLRQGLTGAWCPSLGATGYTLLDRSGRNNHGTLTNMGGQDNWSAIGNGLALNLDGTNDYIIGSSPPVTTQVTLAFWSYFRTTPTNYPMLLQLRQSTAGNAANAAQILFRPNGDIYGGGSGNRLAFGVNGSVGSSVFPTIAFVSGELAHYAGTYDGSTSRFYKNGTLVSSATVSVSMSGVNEVNIGNNRASSTDGYFSGYLDDLRTFSRALTPSEILLLASRRGIGLSPLPDRGAALPRKLSVNVGGTWRPADAYVNVGGAWKLSQASVNVGGVWK